MDFQKLKLGGYKNILVTNVPNNIALPFKPSKSSFDCLLAFVQTEEQVDQAISKTRSNDGEVYLILAYPKSTSKNYKSQVNRDSILAKIRPDNKFKAPRLVSLDEDWSGFSFKHKP